MKIITTKKESFIDSILPAFGNPRCNLPVWDEGDHMFISDEYESQAGNRYYKGLRFSNRLAIVEKVGLFHNWKYIDSIEIYTFNNDQKVLIGNHKFEKEFYNKMLIYTVVRQMVTDYFESQIKLSKQSITTKSLDKEVGNFVNEAYTSFLSNQYDSKLQQLLPILQAKD